MGTQEKMERGDPGGPPGTGVLLDRVIEGTQVSPPTCSWLSASRALAGSLRRRTQGSLTRAPVMATPYHCPPECCSPSSSASAQNVGQCGHMGTRGQRGGGAPPTCLIAPGQAGDKGVGTCMGGCHCHLRRAPAFRPIGDVGMEKSTGSWGTMATCGTGNGWGHSVDVGRTWCGSGVMWWGRGWGHCREVVGMAGDIEP